MASLAEIRAKLQSMESNSKGSSPAQSDNAIYPFWNIDEGTSTVLRFLPDSDPNNTFFWVERQMIRLTFPGVVGGDQKPTTVQVPCMEMFGENCPVLTEVRRFVIGPQIFNIIKSALMDPEMENLPTDYVNGTDFRLAKTTKGQYADYSTSKWARKESALTEEQLGAIDTHGLYTLNDYLPAKPTEEGVQAIAEMFQASVDGELYDPARWGNFFKPYGLDTGTSTQSASAPVSTTTTESVAPVSAPAPAEAKVEAEPVAEAPATPEPAPATATAEASGDAGKKSADDILAMIRNRQSS